MSRIILMRGDTHQLKFCRLDNNGDPILSPADKLYFTVKKNIDSRTPVLQKTISDMEFDSQTGYYTFVIEPEDTDNLTCSTYAYDIEVVVGDNYKRTISEGEIIIKADVTRPADEV